jgi:hypothetical protein
MLEVPCIGANPEKAMPEERVVACGASHEELMLLAVQIGILRVSGPDPIGIFAGRRRRETHFPGASSRPKCRHDPTVFPVRKLHVHVQVGERIAIDLGRRERRLEHCPRRRVGAPYRDRKSTQ